MLRSFLKTTSSFFFVLAILFIPFPFYFLRIQAEVTDLFFGRFVAAIMGAPRTGITRIDSDSKAMAILLLLLFCLSILAAFLVYAIARWRNKLPQWFDFTRQLLVYYLVLIMLKYGVDKIMLNQFYTPQPNTLYTPFGYLSRDILYWSTMGTSTFYSIFLGIVEVLTALMLLFKKTRLAALMLLTGVMLNVLAVNIGFDISVKLFSVILLLITTYLLLEYLPVARIFFATGAWDKTLFPHSRRASDSLARRTLSWVITAMILLEVIIPFFPGQKSKTQVAYEQRVGAYEVTKMIIGGDTAHGHALPVRRLFFHKAGYLILQSQDDSMTDYKLQVYPYQHLMVITDYNRKRELVRFNMNDADSTIILYRTEFSPPQTIYAKPINWKALPALSPSFKWLTR